MAYTEITREEFEDVLNLKGYKWRQIVDQLAKENIYLVEIDGVSVKIFSSIVAGVSRGIGTDAIRVVGWDIVSNLPVLSSEARVYRTEGWRENLIARIEGVKEKTRGMQKCKICGGVMVERENRTTKEKFLGCLNYKNHPKKDSNVDNRTKGGIDKIGNVDKSRRYDAQEDIRLPVMSNKQSVIDSNKDANKIIDNFREKMGSLSDRLKIQMQEVKGDEPLLETKLFQWGRYPFDKFNVIQSKVAQFVEKDNNVVIEARTSTGKTIMGELFMWKVLKDAKKVIYTSPLKALTREKWDTWTKKFGELGYKMAIVTGDYRLTNKRIKELNDADIILCTSEMLDHRTRNIASEKSEWLTKAGLLIVDEVQLIGMRDRGDKLEAGLMRFTAINPGCRLIFLSGTMPNSGEIASWLYTLNEKETILVKSNWRPVKLNMIYDKYDDKRGYYEAKDNLMAKVMSEVKKHQEDKILIFVHSKADGRRILRMLGEAKYKAEFHNADLEMNDRVNIEESFKSRNNESVRIIIATSTLAYGLNLPARIVIIAGMHRGIEEVSELDIIQMCGRSGRMGIDKEGDAIILLPETQFDKLKKKIENPGNIMSQISNPLIAGFHIIGEVVNKTVATKEDVYKWYSRTLASKQNMEINKEYMDGLINYLLKNNAVREENGKLVETELGKAAVYFYLRPDMLMDLMVNWGKIFEIGVENNDFMVTSAMSRLRMYDDVIVSKAEKGEIENYLKATKAMASSFGELGEGQSKIGVSYLNMLRGIGGMKVIGEEKVVNPLISTQRTLSQDIERIMQALMYIDAKYARWQKGTFWNGMAIRIKYGIGPELVGLCALEGVGGEIAKRLYYAGIRSPIELITKKKEAIMALGARYDGIVERNKVMFETMGYNINIEPKVSKETVKKDVSDKDMKGVPISNEQKRHKKERIDEDELIKLPFQIKK